MSPKRRKNPRAQPDQAREIPIEDAEVEAPASAAPEAADVADEGAPTSADAPAEPEAPEAPEPTAEDRIQDLEDRLKRVQAEFLNETKRIGRQADERAKYAVETLVQDLLPVFDALHSARDGFAGREKAAEDANDAGAAAADHAALEGFELVEKALLNVLGRHGVARIEVVGAAFDPNLHHAIVMMERPDLEPGAVAMELRPGFTLNGRVVRPAHVAVAAAEKES
mgnify:CR=1 FL=1